MEDGETRVGGCLRGRGVEKRRGEERGDTMWGKNKTENEMMMKEKR